MNYSITKYIFMILCIIITILLVFDQRSYKLLRSSWLSLNIVPRTIFSDANVEIIECNFNNSLFTTNKTQCQRIITTLEEFLKIKRMENSEIRSNLTVNSWTATITLTCLRSNGDIIPLTPLTSQSMNIIPHSDSNINNNNNTDIMRQSYWTFIKQSWKITDNMTTIVLPENTVFIRGHIFVTQGDGSNIGHNIQWLSCDMAASIGAKSGPFDGVINWQYMSSPISSIIVKAIQDTIAYIQQPTLLVQIYWPTMKDPICFERLTFQRPNACGGHGLGHRPVNHNHTLKLVRLMLFKRLKFSRTSVSIDSSRHLPCIRRILIYDRHDTTRRRLLNSDTIQRNLATNQCLNVTLLHKWPTTAIDQAQIINSVDALIMPHGAAVYTAIFLPEHAWLIEIGQKTWIKYGLIPALSFSYHYIDFGLDLRPNDNENSTDVFGEPDYSFELNKTAIDFIHSIVNKNVCKCI